MGTVTLRDGYAVAADFFEGSGAFSRVVFLWESKPRLVMQQLHLNHF